MGKYANIIVNISHENLDRTFQYQIPERLQGVLMVGDYVKIPFGKGNRTINGYVLEITDEAEYDPLKMKCVESIEKTVTVKKCDYKSIIAKYSDSLNEQRIF